MNAGRDGVTTNAGFAGTGLSYRQKLGRGGKGGWFGVLAAVGAGLGFWTFQHAVKIEKAVASRPQAVVVSTGLSTKASTDAPSTFSCARQHCGNMLHYGHHRKYILQPKPNTYDGILKKEIRHLHTCLTKEQKWYRLPLGSIPGKAQPAAEGRA